MPDISRFYGVINIIYQVIESIDWLKLLQTVAVIFTAFVAYTALNTWKHQAKAKKQTDFLDELTDIVHEYIQSLSGPLTSLKIIYIGFKSYKFNYPHQSEQNKYSYIIAYIKKEGADDAKVMWEHLNSCDAKVAKIKSIVARGQVYSFNNYGICLRSVEML